MKAQRNNAGCQDTPSRVRAWQEIFRKTTDDRYNLRLLLKAATVLYLAVLLANGLQIGSSPDTEGYFTAGRILLEGNPDFFRTPVFPLICQTARLLFGHHTPYAISLLLFAVMLCSIASLYHTTCLLTRHKRLRLAATALYACNPAIASWCVEDIGTESLALSGMVFLCQLLTSAALTRPRAGNILATCALTFLLVMLRPFFICITPVVLLSFLFQLRSTPRSLNIWAATLIGIVFTGTGILAYCSAIQQRYGMFTLSKVSSINRATIMATPEEQPLLDKFWSSSEGYKEYIREVDQRIARDKSAFMKGRCRDFLLSCAMYYPSAGFGTIGKVMNKVINIPLWFSYAFIAAFVFIQWRRRGKQGSVDRLSVLLVLCCCATIFTAIWGSYAEFPRLMMPMYPCLCLMACLVGNLSLLRALGSAAMRKCRPFK